MDIFDRTSAKVGLAVLTVVGVLFGSAGLAMATTAESLATSAGTSMRDTALGVIAALIPLAVVVLLAKKALPWARKFLHV